jgi:hypothetical protein
VGAELLKLANEESQESNDTVRATCTALKDMALHRHQGYEIAKMLSLLGLGASTLMLFISLATIFDHRHQRQRWYW